MNSKPKFTRALQAVEALKQYDRQGGAALLSAELRDGPATGAGWRSVAMLAAQIGEIDMALEAAARFARTEAAKRWLARVGYDPVYGARPLKRAVLRYLQDALTEMILQGEGPDVGAERIDEGFGALAMAVG